MIVMRTRLQRRLSPAPLLSSDIDVVILAHLNVASLGRCAYVSRGLGAACDQAWRCKAIARWPKIEKTERAVVAAAADPQYKFDWATAFRSTMWSDHYFAPQRQDVDMVIESEVVAQSELSDLIFSIQLSRFPKRPITRDDGLISDDDTWEEGPAKTFFTWSGQCSLAPEHVEGLPPLARLYNTELQTPALWTPETIPAEVTGWWNDCDVINERSRWSKYPDGELMLDIMLYRGSECVNLYNEVIRLGSTTELIFTQQTAPASPCSAIRDPEDRELNQALGVEVDQYISVGPELDYSTGRFTFRGVISNDECTRFDTILYRHIVSLPMSLNMPESGRLRGEAPGPDDDCSDEEY